MQRSDWTDLLNGSPTQEVEPDLEITDATKAHDQASESEKQRRKRKMTMSQQAIDIRQNITSTRERKRRTHGIESGRPVSETLPIRPIAVAAQPRDRPSLGSIKVTTSTHINKRSGGGNRAHGRV